jgi:hypothetical protein
MLEPSEERVESASPPDIDVDGSDEDPDACVEAVELASSFDLVRRPMGTCSE